MTAKVTTLWVLLGIVTFHLGLCKPSYAEVLTNEYSIAATATSLNQDSYIFTYDVTNINQGSGSPQGLTGFDIQVPITATISNISLPEGYAEGYWISIISTTDTTSPYGESL
jgi:hypothetical protein